MRRTIGVGIAVVVSGAAAWFVSRTSSRVSPANQPGLVRASGTADGSSALPPPAPSPALAGRPTLSGVPATSHGAKPVEHAEADPQRGPIASLLEELSAPDAALRRASADRIVEAGYFATERVLRQAASLDAESWQTFADAVLRKTWPPSPLGALVAAAHTAPEAHRRRLIDLARRLDPEAGSTPTPQEIDTIVQREIVAKAGMADDWPAEAFVNFGHAGVPALLRLVAEGEPDAAVVHRASSALSSIAQPEDIPALRGLLVEGTSSVAGALGRLDALGFTEASDALIEAVRSGQLNDRIISALCHTSNREHVARAVREWVAAHGPSLTDADRVSIANLFAALESRADVSILEAWSSSSRDAKTLLTLAGTLTALGSVKGIDMLVRIVEEKQVEPASQPGPQDDGRLSVGGFEDRDRWVALRALDAVAVQLSSSEDDSSAAPPRKGTWGRATDGQLEQMAAEVRAWWEAARGRVQFDEKAGAWRLRSD